MHPMMQWWLGAVRFEAFGGYPERFLSEAAEREIAVWDTARQGVSLIGHCCAAEYRRLRPVAKKSGVRLRVTRRRGLPFLLRPFRLRWGLAVGAVAAIAILQLLAGRVWVITVEGNEQVSDREILQVLEPLGVAVGADFGRVDIPAVQLAALRQLPTLGWLTVNQSGSTVQVLVREKQVSVPLEDDAPANVVAAADGIVRRITVADGQAAVKVGDAVTKGTLLISGVTDSAVGPLLRRAQGSVLAQTVETVTVTVPLHESVTVPQVAALRPTAVFFGVHIPLYTNRATEEAYTEEHEEVRLRAKGKALPIGWTLTKRIVQRQETVVRTAEEARAEAYRRLQEQEAAMTAVTVEDKRVTEAVDADGVTVTAVYTLVRELGVTQPIEIH